MHEINIRKHGQSFSRTLLKVFLASASVVVLANTAEAEDKYFVTGGIQSLWTLPLSWRSGSGTGPTTTMPTAADRVILDEAHATPILHATNTSYSVGQILVRGASFDADGDGFSQTGNTLGRLMIYGLPEGSTNLGFDVQINSFYVMPTVLSLAAVQTWRIDNPDGGTMYFAPGSSSRVHHLDLQEYLLTVDTVNEMNVARIDTEIRGTGGIVKTGEGTMTVGNPANSFTGPTVVEAGKLALMYNELTLASTRHRGDAPDVPAASNRIGDGTLATSSGVEVRSAGTLDISAIQADGTDIKTLSGDGKVVLGDKTLNLTAAADVFAGTISGDGGLTIAAGTETLSGPNTYLGPTTIAPDATLAAGAEGAFSTASPHLVGGGGSMLLAGFSQTVGALENNGLVDFGGRPGTTLTVAGPYSGDGGALLLSTVLGDDNSLTDQLVVRGDMLGTTNVQVINAGGTGAPTTEGIKIIDVEGGSNGTVLLVGDYDYRGQQAVVGGAYAYTLHQHGISTPGDGDWYLRSALLNPPPQLPEEPQPPVPEEPALPRPPRSVPPSPPPLYHPGVPVYESYIGLLLALNSLYAWGQRMDDQGAIDANGDMEGMWGRVTTRHLEQTPSRSTSGADFETSIRRLELGLERLLVDDDTKQLIGGLSFNYDDAYTEVSSVHGSGSIDSVGYGAGATLTWRFLNGNYTSLEARANWTESHLSSGTAGRTLVENNKAFGYSFGLEAGRDLLVSPRFGITPQTQLVYSRVSHDDFVDPFGATVSSEPHDSLKGRVGLAVDYISSASPASEAKLYGIANLNYEFLNGTSTDVAGVTFENEPHPLWASMGIGGSYAFGETLSVYGEVDFASSLNNFGGSRTMSGTIGMKLRW